MSNELTRNSEQTPEVRPLEARRTVTPRVDVYENEAEYLLLVDMPGVPQRNLKVKLDKHELTLEGEVALGADDGELLLGEFEPVVFQRTFTVPRNVNLDGIGADLNHGVLAVHLPRSEAYKPREIPVRLA